MRALSLRSVARILRNARYRFALRGLAAGASGPPFPLRAASSPVAGPPGARSAACGPRRVAPVSACRQRRARLRRRASRALAAPSPVALGVPSLRSPPPRPSPWRAPARVRQPCAAGSGRLLPPRACSPLRGSLAVLARGFGVWLRGRNICRKNSVVCRIGSIQLRGGAGANIPIRDARRAMILGVKLGCVALNWLPKRAANSLS